MTTKEFVVKYNLDKENAPFKKNEFLDDLSIDMEKLIQEQIERIKPRALEFKMFHNIVKQVNQKFWAISNKRNGQAFTFEFWSAFYATHVISARAKYFPEIHAEIEKKKQSYNNPKSSRLNQGFED